MQQPNIINQYEPVKHIYILYSGIPWDDLFARARHHSHEFIGGRFWSNMDSRIILIQKEPNKCRFTSL